MIQAKQLLSNSRGSATYLITFSCHGQHLHGNGRGSVDRLHNQPGTRVLTLDEPRHKIEAAVMWEPAYSLAYQERFAVLQAIREVCEYRGWVLVACHVRTTHVHVVVTSEAGGEKLMNDFKAYASRALNKRGEKRNKRWARHGSIRGITNRDQLVKAIRYVIDEQGEPMAVWSRSG